MKGWGFPAQSPASNTRSSKRKTREHGSAQDGFPGGRMQERSAEQEAEVAPLRRSAGGHPQPRLSPGTRPAARTQWRVLTDFPTHSLFTAAQPEHLVKLRFRLLASSVRAQVKVVGLWVLLALGAPARQTPFLRLLALQGSLTTGLYSTAFCLLPSPSPGSPVGHSGPSPSASPERRFCSFPGTCARAGWAT